MVNFAAEAGRVLPVPPYVFGIGIFVALSFFLYLVLRLGK